MTHWIQWVTSGMTHKILQSHGIDETLRIGLSWFVWIEKKTQKLSGWW